MRKNIWLIWLLILFPFLLGSTASAAAQLFFQPVPLLVFKVDVGIVAMVFGAIVSLFLLGMFVAGQITESRSQRKLDESLREVEKGQRRFLRRLDHEIKNPLTGLQAALANVRESVSESERNHAVQNAGHAVERLTHLLADLRKLADLEERTLEQLAIDIPELLQDIVAAVEALPAHENRKVNILITRVPWPFPPVKGDRDLLGLVFYNLVENALKFTTGQDPVEVRALEDGRAIVVEVADGGPGIPAEDLERIFEELYRGVNARGTEGSGLGLALVKRIVSLHGGEVSVRSRQDEPHGTVFTVRIPVSRGGKS